MPGWMDFMARLFKSALLLLLMLGGLLIGLLIAIKVLLVFLLVRLWRRGRPLASRGSASGQVYDAEFTVVGQPPSRASVLVPERISGPLSQPER